MSHSLLRRRIIGLLAATCLVLLPGCSTLRLGYGQAASFTYWWLDGYVDFNDAQSIAAREQLASFFTWHRGTQLPDYATLLARARGEVLHDTTPAQACEWFEQVRARMTTSLRQATPGFTEVGRTLTPAQVQHMAKKFEKVNVDFTETFLQPDRADRHKASVKRAVDRAEFFYGALTRAQRDIVVQGVANSPFDPELWLVERRQRQQDILQALQGLPRQDAAGAAQTVGGLLNQALGSPRTDYQAYEDRLYQYNCGIGAQLHNSTTPAQRQSAAGRLKDWEEDMIALAAKAR